MYALAAGNNDFSTVLFSAGKLWSSNDDTKNIHGCLISKAKLASCRWTDVLLVGAEPLQQSWPCIVMQPDIN